MIKNIFKILEQLGFGSQTRAISAQFSNPLLNAQVFVQRIDGTSGLNQDNSYELLCLSTNAHLELKQFMGCSVCVDTVTDMGRLARKTGVVFGVSQGCSDGALTVYKLQLQSGLGLLEKRRNSRVFMNKTVPEIIQIIFKEWQERSPLFASSLSLDLTGITQDYDIRPFTMQASETDFVFITRLLKESGINFFVDEAQTFVTHNSEPIQAQKLRLVDDNHQFEALQRRSIRFHRSDATERFDTITQFIAERSLQPTSVHIQRWQPDALEQEDGAGSVLSWHKHSERHDNESLALEDAWHISPAWMQDLNGEDGATKSGNAQVEKLNENLSKQHNLNAKYFTAHSTVRDAQIGYWFEFNGHPEIDEHKGSDQEFLILSKHFYNQNNLPKDIQKQVENLLTQSRWQEQIIEEQDQRQGNTLTLVRRSTAVVPQYHPEKDKPTVHVQRAKVVGLEGEQIHVDEWGRIKVRFLFSREEDNTHDGGAGSNNTDTDSAWVDVLTPWAGEGYGARFLPRVGEIVVVDFFDGNPDRPFVIGRLHEAERAPTQFDQKGKLPDTKKLSGIRSQEVDGNGFNQLRFDDTTGQISAQLQSSHGASQLNLGNLSHPKETETSEGRGEGFELRTDEYGAVRAGQGLIISTYSQKNAEGGHLEAASVKEQLIDRLNTSHVLSDIAKNQETQPLELLENLKAFLNNLESESAEKAKAFKDAILLLASPESVALSSRKDIYLSADGQVNQIAGQSINTSTLDNLTSHAGKRINFFAAQNGIGAIAGAGSIDIEAQNSTLHLLAQKGIEIFSTDGEVHISSPQKIVLKTPQGQLEISDGIKFITQQAIEYKATQHQFTKGDKVSVPERKFKKPTCYVTFSITDLAGKPAKNVEYMMFSADGTQQIATTNAQGKTQRIETEGPERVSIFICDKNASKYKILQSVSE